MRQFGELEAVIMERLWERGRPALVRELVDDLRENRPIAYTAVMTVMENLHRKGWLRRHRDGRAWRYEPTGSRSGYTASLMSDALDTSTDRRNALAHVVLQRARTTPPSCSRHWTRRAAHTRTPSPGDRRRRGPGDRGARG